MLSREYSEAATEVLDILKHTNINDVKKIPVGFIEFLKNNSSKDYEVKLDHSKRIDEMDIKEETKGILGAIYRNWWCTKEEKQNFEKIIDKKELEYQEELREKYNPDKLFEKKIKKEESSNEKNLALKEYKESFLTRIINKIKSLFKL